MIGFWTPSPGACEVGLPVRRVNRPDIVRHQSLDVLADQGVAFIVEQRLRAAVDIPDHPCPIHPHQCARHRLQETPEVHLVWGGCHMPGSGLFTARRHLFSLRTEAETRTSYS